MSLADELRKAIQESGTLKALAERSGVTGGQLSRFLRGERDLRVATADALLKALQLEVKLTRIRKGR